MDMWAIISIRNAVGTKQARGYVIAHSIGIAEFVARRNSAVIVACLGPVGAESHRPLLVWDDEPTRTRHREPQVAGLFEVRHHQQLRRE